VASKNVTRLTNWLFNCHDIKVDMNSFQRTRIGWNDRAQGYSLWAIDRLDENGLVIGTVGSPNRLKDIVDGFKRGDSFIDVSYEVGEVFLDLR